MKRIYEFLRDLLWPMYSTQWRQYITFSAGVVAGLSGMITVLLMIGEPPGTSKPVWALYALILWAALPPAWFWFEYYCVWKPENPVGSAGSEKAFDRFKYGQEVSRNIWLAFVALLAGFYFK